MSKERPTPRAASLVLSGGGANGAFQVGVLDALAEEERFRWKSVYGVSAGALNAVLMGQERLSALRSVWLDEAHELVQKRPWWRFAYGLLFGTTGIYDNGALKARLREIMDEAPFKIPTHVGFVSLRDGKYRMASSHTYGFAEKVIASTSIPIIFDQAKPEGEALGDGGLRNATPLSDAIASGAVRIVAIVNRPKELGEKSVMSGFVHIFERTLEILLHEISENDLEQCRRINQLMLRVQGGMSGYRHVDLNIIRPLSSLGSALDFTPEHIELNYRRGVKRGRDFLRGV